MLKHKDNILSLFKSDKFSFALNDEQMIIKTTFVTDFRLQQLEYYCFNNRLYYDVTADKKNVVITVHNDKN